MKFFTVEEIIFSVVFSLILGIAFGCIFSTSEAIFSSLNKLIFSPAAVYRKINNFSKESVEEIILYKPTSKLSHFSENIRDAILFSFFGIATLILVYITLDGIFRLYIAVTIAIAFILAKKTLGKLFCKIFERVFQCLYKSLVYIEYFILYPIHFILKFFKIRFIKLWRPINIRLTEKKNESLINKKISEIKNISCVSRESRKQLDFHV